MTTLRLTWQPGDSNTPETMTAAMSPARAAELQQLLADGTDFGETAMWIDVRLDSEPPHAPFMPRLFRLARITEIEVAR